MNIPSTSKGEDNEDLVSESEISAACDAILASDAFTAAPRMCRLLRFLVKQAINGDARDTKEYVIGIKVFDRDPASYRPTEDPTVRVQIGRLRKKLQAYYAASSVATDIEISVPLGSYMPVIRRINVMDPDQSNPVLAIQQIKCIARCKDGEPFTRGLHEELIHRLFEAFEHLIVIHPRFAPSVANDESIAIKTTSHAVVHHLLEGSIRVDSDRIRASIRLVDASLGCIAWSKQFDRNVFFAIALQEELALSICNEIKQFFCHM